VTGNNRKKVFVSGCFDLLHSGHIAFFEQAANYGDIYVAIGSDKTIFELKGREPVNNEDERLYMVKSLSMVKEAFISKGSGMLDFLDELAEIKPDIFIVNTDGNTPDKRALCEELQIEYKVLHREPHQGLPPRSTTDLRTILAMPYRIERSGMATSTRRKASELWGPKMPAGDYEKIAKILFCFDNPPGTEEISGSQDAIGLVYPGLAIAHYNGEYWPYKIDSVQSEDTLQFIENALYLIPLGPRESSFSVLENTHITKKRAQALSEAAYACWDAILAHDAGAFGRYMRESFEAQIAMFPNMIIHTIIELIEQYRESALGWKVSGAGGGGYLILVANTEIEDALRVKIRRANGN
jgi:cytidyltransferase-like protein